LVSGKERLRKESSPGPFPHWFTTATIADNLPDRKSWSALYFIAVQFTDLHCRLARYDLVITTYGTVMSETKLVLGKSEGKLDDLKPEDLEKQDRKL